MKHKTKTWEVEYNCELCGKKFTTGAIIPNKKNKKTFELCADCFEKIEIYAMIHKDLGQWIKELKKESQPR